MVPIRAPLSGHGAAYGTTLIIGHSPARNAGHRSAEVSAFGTAGERHNTTGRSRIEDASANARFSLLPGVHAYDHEVTSAEATTLLSVRGEAQRTSAPDQARVFSTVSATSESKSAAVAEIHAALPSILADLAGLGGEALTAATTRAALTWSIHSMHTHEEHDHDKVTGAHGPTGRHQSSVSLLVTIRNLSLVEGVAAVLTGRDSVAVHSVSWSVDEDNAEWALVRADAIDAALLKGQDYAAALGGTVIGVDHIADAGLLSGDGSAGMFRHQNLSSASGGSGEDTSLDPVPQVLSATIEARFTAVVSARPAR